MHDKAFLDNIFENEQIDAVIHFAAYSLVGERVVNPLKYYDNNLCGTKILLDSMVEHHIDKIVFSSTAATYGEPESIPILETDRTQPTNPYQTCYGEDVLLDFKSSWSKIRFSPLFQCLRSRQIR